MDWGAFSTISSHWPTDWITIGAFAAFVALDSLRNGPARAASVALALPATLLLVGALPQALFLASFSLQFETPVGQLIIFAIVFGLLFFAIHRVVFNFSESRGPLQALMAGLAAAVILVVVWLQVPALQSVWDFGPQVEAVFGETYRFWWLVASYVALVFTRS